MADDSPEVAALKAQKAEAEAQRDVAKAQLEALQAQQALADATAGKSAAQAKADAEAKTAIYTQQKAASDAQAAAAAADVAATKAQVGTVTGSSYTGEITVTPGAGNGEASLLAASAVQTAAHRIVKALAESGLPTDRRYILFAGLQRPAFGNWRAFEVQLNVVDSSFDRADQAKAAADQAAANQAAASVSPPKHGAGPVESVTAVGAAFDVLSKLGSYFQSNYAIGPATITGSDDDLLAVSVAGGLTDAWYPGRWAPPTGAATIWTLMQGIAAQRDSSNPDLATVKANADHWTSASEKETDAKKKEAMKNVAALYTRAAVLYVAAQKRFDDLLDSLTSVDKDGTPLATKIVDEKFIADELSAGSYALFVHLNAGVGGYYTKKNLWTFFGGMPFYVSGGAIASFVAVDGVTGNIKKAGQFAIHSGYLKMNKVEEKFK